MEERLDENTGRTYFYNTLTGESKWTLDDDLPPGWSAALDPTSKLTYYYNVEGETRWMRPGKEMTQADAVNVIIGCWRSKKAREEVRRMIGKVYEEVFDEETGRTFFYNRRTGESSWEKPKLLGSAEFQPETLQDILAESDKVQEVFGSDWIEYFNEAKMKSLYHNPITNEIQWEIPELEEEEEEEIIIRGPKPRRYPRSKMQLIIDEIEDSDAPEILDLSGFQAPKLSSRVWNFDTLTTLCLRKNKLTRLSSGIQDLDQLTSLDVSDNQLTKLPNCMQTMRSLKILNASENNISTFSPKLWMMKGLETLDLSFNLFTSLPSLEGDLDLLQSTGEWIVSIGMLETLTHLNLGHNSLTEWPLGLEKCTTLNHLDLSHNKIQQLYKQIGKLRALQDLLIQNNELKDVPESLGECLELKVLLAGDNSIESLPESLSNLIQMQQIELQFNNLGALSSSFKSWSHLQTLRVDHNPLRNIPAVFPGWLGFEQGELHNCKLEMLPKDLFQGSEAISLKNLNFSRNEIAILPENFEIVQKTLTRLNLSFNLLKKLPSDLFKCEKLYELDVSNNRISENFPNNGLNQLIHLSVLNLSYNQLQTIPPGLSELKHLKHLNLSDNLIQKLPLDLGNLATLEFFNVSNCKIATVPMSLRQMNQLVMLNFSGNDLQKYPPALYNIQVVCPELRVVDLSNNPIQTDRSDEFFKKALRFLDKNEWKRAEEYLTKIITNIADPYAFDSITHRRPFDPKPFYTRGIVRAQYLSQIQTSIDQLKTQMESIRDQKARIQVDLSRRAVKMQRKSKKPIQNEEKHLNLAELTSQLSLLPQQLVETRLERETCIQGAIQDLTVAIMYNFEKNHALLVRGNVFMKANAFGEAIDDYSQIITACPSNAKLFSLRAIAYSRLGQLPLAIEDVIQALERAPMDDEYTDQLQELKDRWDLYYLPCGVNDPAYQRSFFQDPTGLGTRTDREGMFKIECDRLRAKNALKHEKEQRELQMEYDKMARVYQSVAEKCNQVRCRRELNAAEQDQLKRERLIREWEEKEAEMREKEHDERELMRYEEDYMRWLMNETRSALEQEAILENERQNKLKEKQVLKTRLSRRGGRRKRG